MTEGRAALVTDGEVLFALLGVVAMLLVAVEAQVVFVDVVEVVVDVLVLFPANLVLCRSSRPFTMMAILGLDYPKLMRSKLLRNTKRL